MKNIHIIAQEFQTPGNCGALARVMNNFDAKKLIMLNPKCDFLGKESMDRATHSKDILKKAEVAKSLEYLRIRFDLLIGTTAMVGNDFNIPRNPLSPEQLAGKVKGVKSNIGIIIGREGGGLSNAEVALCDFVVTIPTSKKSPVMNVSHAASVILYELFKKSEDTKISGHIRLAGRKEKDIFMLLANKTLKQLFESEYKLRVQGILWKKIVGKSFLTRRELFALFGFFKKVSRRIK